MKHQRLRTATLAALVVLLTALAIAVPADAARVGILTNRYATETAADFTAAIPNHTFTGVDTSSSVPTLTSLTAQFDLLLLFEDRTFANAPAVGNVVAAFANTGRGVALGSFYDQERSDAPATNTPHGWGTLEQLDPNTTDGDATPYVPRTLNVTTMRRHPLTRNVTALSSARYAGGNQAKTGSSVVAAWAEPNARGQIDPAIAFRITGPACVVHIGIAPNYPAIGVAGTDFSGDFHRVWRNAFDFMAGGCPAAFDDPHAIPTLSDAGLALTMLLVVAGAFAARRRRATR